MPACVIASNRALPVSELPLEKDHLKIFTLTNCNAFQNPYQSQNISTFILYVRLTAIINLYFKYMSIYGF